MDTISHLFEDKKVSSVEIQDFDALSFKIDLYHEIKIDLRIVSVLFFYRHKYCFIFYIYQLQFHIAFEQGVLQSLIVTISIAIIFIPLINTI